MAGLFYFRTYCSAFYRVVLSGKWKLLLLFVG